MVGGFDKPFADDVDNEFSARETEKKIISLGVYLSKGGLCIFAFLSAF
jgi:hypothetical protein